MKRYLTYLALIAATTLLTPGPAVAQVHFGLPSAVKSTVKKLKSKKNTATVSSIVLGPLTKVLTTDTNSKFLGVAADSVTYRYSLSAGQITGLAPGNIIMSSQGYGYLKKVVSLTNTGSEYQVLTATAGLNEAFDVLKLHFHKTITPADATVQSLPQSIDVSEQFNLSTNTIIFDGDGNHGTTNDQITTMLGFKFGIDVEVDIDMPDPQHLNRFLLKINTEKELSFNFGAKVGASISKEFPLSPEIKVPIWEAPPIVLKISPKYQTTFSLGGGFDLEIGGTKTSYTGVICDNDCFNGNNWRVESSSTSSFGVTKASGSAQLSLQMGPVVEISALLGGIVGPFFELGAGGKAAVTTPVNHLPYTVSLVVEASGGVKAEINKWFVHVSLFSIEASLLSYEYVIKNGVLLNQSPQISSLTLSTASVSPSGATTVTCSASDPEGDSLTYAWSAASGTLSSTSGTPVTWTVPSTPGTYTINVIVTDGYGGSVQSSTNVTVTGVLSGGDSYEPDNDYTTAKTITPGIQQTRSIVPATDVDWMKFSLAGATDITLETSGPAASDTRVWLYNSDLAEIDNDDDDGVGNFSKLISTGLAAGTYYVKIDEYNNNDEIAEYYISFTSLTVTSWSAPQTPIGADVYVPKVAIAVNQTNNNVYIVYWDRTGSSSKLQYTKWNGISWSAPVPLDTVVSDAPSIAIDSGGNVHIVYATYGTNLKYIKLTPGGAFTPNTISDLGGGAEYFKPQIAVDSSDSPHILTKLPGIGLVHIDPSNLDVIDSNPVSYAKVGIAIDSSNNIHVSYPINNGNALAYRKRVGGAWQSVETVNSEAGSIYSLLKADANGNPHITYQSINLNPYTTTSVKYANKLGGPWTSVTLDSSQLYTSDQLSLVMDSAGNSHIIYFQGSGNGDLVYVTNTTGTNIVRGPNLDGLSTAIAMDSAGQLHVVYTTWSNVYYIKK